MPFDISALLNSLFHSFGNGGAQGVGSSAMGGGGGMGGLSGGFNPFNMFSQNTHTTTTGGPNANPYISQVAQTANQAGSRSGLPALDANTQNALNSITNATQMKANQTFHDQQSGLLQQLYGNGAEHSSGAGDMGARLLQGQGLVNAQIQADAASRQLGQQNTSADRSLQGLGMQQQGLGQAAGLTNDQNQLAAQQQMQQFQAMASLLPMLLQMRQQQQAGGGMPSPTTPQSFGPPHLPTPIGGTPSYAANGHTDPILQTLQGSGLSPDMQRFYAMMLQIKQMGLGQQVTGGYDPMQYVQAQANSYNNSQANPAYAEMNRQR